jgi:hypothetical protein
MIGLVRELKTPVDNRVALTPRQCRWLLTRYPGLEIRVQPSPHRCFDDDEYRLAGARVTEDLAPCDFLMGIKERPAESLIPGKTYLFFSHTRKKQPRNRDMLQGMLDSKIRLIDFESMEFEDGQRIIGFGFFAGIVGAHNGIMAWGNRSGLFQLERVYRQRSFKELIHTYFGLRLPSIKIVVTGSGRVAHGLIEIMNLMGILEVEPDEYLNRSYPYAVYTRLNGADLFELKTTTTQSGQYSRDDFHLNPHNYRSKFLPYTFQTDILMNGLYWESGAPRFFEPEDIRDPGFRIRTISDVADDKGGAVPINLGPASIEDPVYGVDRQTLQKTEPYLESSIDVLAVDNLPNELPRDASRYFGEQLIKYVLDELFAPNSVMIDNATIARDGKLGRNFQHLRDWVVEK